MKDVFKDMGVDMLKDSPFFILLLSWVGDVDWLIVASLIVAVARAYIAYKEYQLKEKNAENKKPAPK